MFKRTMIYKDCRPTHNQFGEEDGGFYVTNIYLSFDEKKKCIVVEQKEACGWPHDSCKGYPVYTDDIEERAKSGETETTITHVYGKISLIDHPEDDEQPNPWDYVCECGRPIEYNHPDYD